MAKSSQLKEAILNRAGQPVGPGRAGVRYPEAAVATPADPSRQPSRVGKVSICGHFTPETRRQLRRLALDTDTTAQDLLGEALNDLFAKHGLPELVERTDDAH